ncbi:MAG: twin-arginine translocase TatA/TatE family subunit [Gammaproteobacteria bacterium]|nr:twin-arginine translocase TatA/TatE family subunit [Gammaproteobacteria bacterium]
MPGGFGLTELLVVLAIVLLIFGPKRLKNIGADLGNAIKGFRTAVTDDEKPSDAESDAEPDADPSVIEGEVAAQKTETKQDTHV